MSEIGFMRGSRNIESFCKWGLTLTVILGTEGRREDPNNTESGPPSPFKWRFAGGPMVSQHWMLDW